jgi:WD40 repeat protein
LTVLAYQHDGQLLASADEDGEVFYWRPTGSRKLLARTGLRDSISHMSWSPDDRLMALGSGSGELAVAEVGGGQVDVRNRE